MEMILLTMKKNGDNNVDDEENNGYDNVNVEVGSDDDTVEDEEGMKGIMVKSSVTV